MTVWSLAFPIQERAVDYSEWAGEGSELDARVLQVKFSERWPALLHNVAFVKSFNGIVERCGFRRIDGGGIGF